MACIKDENIIKVGDGSPVVCRNINIYAVYTLHTIISVHRLFWLPPWFYQLQASEDVVSILQIAIQTSKTQNWDVDLNKQEEEWTIFSLS